MARSPVIRVRGFSLIEVMIAVVVLSFGLLALSALQAGLFRAGAEAKARANATALAQNAIENARSFAYVNAPPGYAGPTYSSLATASLGSQAVGGVTYSVAQTVSRFRWSAAAGVFAADAATTGSVDASQPEFKNVEVAVTWTADDGTTKRIEIEDSIPAVAPADSIQVVKTPNKTMGGPQVWIVPPNKDNPQVVPIAVGDDKSAASTNPKPEQFVEDLSAATRFSVQLFTGSSSGDEVRLNRKLDVAAVSCLCSRTGSEVSTSSQPAYTPAVWNGKQQAYVEPQPAPSGTKIGTAVTTNSDITPMCTVCCRDHREQNRTNPRQDPYRALATGESADEHWGYRKQGANNYLIGEPLVQWGTSTSATSGEYLEACQLVRVNGRMRVAVDASKVDLQVAPLSDDMKTYRDPSFITDYAAYVKQLVKDGMASLPAGYASPTARFPGASSALAASYSSMTDPAVIDLTSAAVGSKRKLVAFGLYLDYLSPDTRAAYACALSKSTASECAGLGSLDPLEVLPFYAVNVANLGTWTSSRAGALSVADAQYKQGLLVDDGGIVTVQAGTFGTSATAAESNILVTLQINRSNSGLAGTLPIDPDDATAENVLQDLQKFRRLGSSGGPVVVRNTLFVKLSSTSTLSIKSLTVTSPAGVTICQQVSGSDPTKECRFDAPATALTVAITGYTTSAKVKGSTVITNRKVCVPSTMSRTVTGDGTTSDTTNISLPQLDAGNPYTLTVDIVDESAACPGTATLVRS